MSLLYQLDRGRDVDVPKTARKLRNYYNPIPLRSPTIPATRGETKVGTFGPSEAGSLLASLLTRGSETQLIDQLRRGPKKPNSKARIIDHNINEAIATQDHGVKIRIADQSLAKLNASNPIETITRLRNVVSVANRGELDGLVQAIGLPAGSNRATITNWLEAVEKGQIKTDNETLRNVIKNLNTIAFMHGQRTNTDILAAINQTSADQIQTLNNVLATINQASADQIQAMANVIGTPITDKLEDNRRNVTNWFRDLHTSFIEPNKEQQEEIIDILDDIRDSSSVKVQPTANVTDGGIITPGKWKSMDPAERTIMLRQTANRYLQQGNTIKEGKDPADMTDRWAFITGDNKLIQNKEVKRRMKSGQYILDLNKFIITKP